MFDANGYLPPGFHAHSVSSFRSAFVAPLAGPYADRPSIDAGYEKVVQTIQLLGLGARQWVGGSFVTSRTQPRDIDLVTFVNAHELEGLSHPVRALLKTYFDGKQTESLCRCDSHLVPVRPPDHPMVAEFEELHAYWLGRFEKDWDGKPKGIVQIQIDGTAPIDTSAEGNDDSDA